MQKLKDIKVENKMFTCLVENDVLPDHPVLKIEVEVLGPHYQVRDAETGEEVAEPTDRYQLRWLQEDLLIAVYSSSEYQRAC